MTAPEHANARRDEIVRNMREVIRVAKDGGSLTDGSGMQIKPLHDMSRDLDELTHFAGKWEAHCREFGLDPRRGTPIVAGEWWRGSSEEQAAHHRDSREVD